MSPEPQLASEGTSKSNWQTVWCTSPAKLASLDTNFPFGAKNIFSFIDLPQFCARKPKVFFV